MFISKGFVLTGPEIEKICDHLISTIAALIQYRSTESYRITEEHVALHDATARSVQLVLDLSGKVMPVIWKNYQSIFELLCDVDQTHMSSDGYSGSYGIAEDLNDTIYYIDMLFSRLFRLDPVTFLKRGLFDAYVEGTVIRYDQEEDREWVYSMYEFLLCVAYYTKAPMSAFVFRNEPTDVVSSLCKDAIDNIFKALANTFGITVEDEIYLHTMPNIATALYVDPQRVFASSQINGFKIMIDGFVAEVTTDKYTDVTTKERKRKEFIFIGLCGLFSMPISEWPEAFSSKAKELILKALALIREFDTLRCKDKYYLDRDYFRSAPLSIRELRLNQSITFSNSITSMISCASTN